MDLRRRHELLGLACGLLLLVDLGNNGITTSHLFFRAMELVVGKCLLLLEVKALGLLEKDQRIGSLETSLQHRESGLLGQRLAEDLRVSVSPVSW